MTTIQTVNTAELIAEQKHKPLFHLASAGYVIGKTWSRDNKEGRALPVEGDCPTCQSITNTTFEGASLLISVPRPVTELLLDDCRVDGLLRITGLLHRLVLKKVTVGGPLIVSGLRLRLIFNKISIDRLTAPRIVVNRWNYRLFSRHAPDIRIEYGKE